MKHIFPRNDKFKHANSIFCKCEPDIYNRETGYTNNVAIHNLMEKLPDFRDIIGILKDDGRI